VTLGGHDLAHPVHGVDVLSQLIFLSKQ
jgi:hypothetical protein